MVNESGNAILRKLHKLEKSVAPSSEKTKAWRLAVLAARKVRKIAFFTVFASPGGVTIVARRFISKKPKIGLLLMRCLAAHSNPLGGF